MTLVNGVLIQAPINQRDIQGALGLSSSVNKWSQLCTHGRINKWAKYKPISYNTPANLTVAQRKSANYGITNIPVWSGNGAVNKMGNFWFGVDTSDTNLPQCGRVVTGYWWYDSPKGGASSPYREKDFINYKHDVVAPIGGCTLSTIYISATGSLTIPFSGNGSGQSDGYTVPLGELTGVGVSTGMFGNLYMSVMIRKVGTSTYYVASRDSKWSDDNSTSVTRAVTAAIGNALAGNCEVFPFLSTKKFESFTSSLSGETGPTVAMFGKSSVTISIQYAQADPNGFVAYYQNLTDHSLSYGFSLTNNSSASFRASYTVSFSSQSTFPDTDTVKATGSVYISAGATESISGSKALSEQTAAHYRNGYARLEVSAEAGYGIIFYHSTSAAANITQGLPR